MSMKIIEMNEHTTAFSPIKSEEELKFAVAFLDMWQRSQEHGVNFEQVLKDAIQQATPNEDRKWVSIK
ncbi:hypothetical protein ACUA1R_004483 [Enterobacter hormaechei]|uniref:hypothetical protein n=1 Tax=Enterobacter cloacae complex TaxID=354276 RepID=UPI001FE379ED|nr:hypothetical protein [Enterobacter hormaechei]MDV5434579.1 hypothetical protein [Enterobacter hormaechei]